MNRRSKAGVLDRAFARLQTEQSLSIHIESECLDSTTIKLQPDGTEALKKRSAGHWPFPGRMHHQNSSGYRE